MRMKWHKGRDKKKKKIGGKREMGPNSAKATRSDMEGEKRMTP